ncbi:MAG: hypothetical protein ACM31C_19915 [Acidobacteriota bacterium]
MRIGELLLGQGKIRQSELALALDEQQRSGKRLVSLLVAARKLDFDDGSRALGEQRGMPCVLTKHLSARDPSLAKLLPAELGRTRCALPIGRASNGALIVCVREPDKQLQEMLAATTKGTVTLVLAPATRLEELVGAEYGPAHDDFDVDLGSAIGLPPAPAPPLQPPMPDMDALDPESVRLALTDLDDVRVAKDPGQSGQLQAQGKRPSTLPPPPPTFDQTRSAIERAATRDEATDIVMRFVAGRWVASVVLAIRGDRAIGYRGHGSALGKVETIVVSLAAPSTVQRAIETRRTSIQLVNGPAQDELSRRLGTSSLSAAPVIVREHVVAAIVVGDPIHGLGDTERSIAELGRLAQLLGGAYERVLGTR